MHTVGGTAERVIPETQQRRLVHGCHQPDISAVTPVAAIGTTTVHMGLPAPRDRSGSSITSARVQLGLVNEAGHSCSA